MGEGRNRCDCEKKGKAIFLRSLPFRQLIIYPNSNISALLFDDEAERKAISVLSRSISDEAKRLAQMANGCHVHVLGKRIGWHQYSWGHEFG